MTKDQKSFNVPVSATSGVCVCYHLDSVQKKKTKSETRQKQLVLITCEVERCGVAALCVSAVDILWGAEFLDSGQAALLGSVQQGSITPQQVLDVCVSIFHHVQRHVAVTVLLGWVGSVLNKRV